jgi:hypothetical protein
MRHLPVREVLEPRHLLSGSEPANTLAIVDGTVPAPGAVTRIEVPVTAYNINGRVPIVIGTATSPTSGSSLLPRVIAALGPDGKPLPLHPGAPYKAGVHDEATAFVQVTTPGMITLEVTGTNRTDGSFQLREYLPGDINGDGQVTYADLALFPKLFLSRVGDAVYNPAADSNLNGQIGIDDARAMVRNLNPGVPKGPLSVNLYLRTSEDVKQNIPSNSGGHTYYQNPTIMGHTTPGSMVFFDSSFGDYQFNGGAIPTDAQGDFHVSVKLTQGINNNDFLVISPFGQQRIQDYPIYYFPGVYSRTFHARQRVSGHAPATPAPAQTPSPVSRPHHPEVLPAGTPP